MQQCIVCNGLLRGRPDKKFCSKSCSNRFHSDKGKKQKAAIVNSVNQILRKNHKILLQLFEGDKRQKKKIDKLILAQLGFDFNYITGIYFNREGKLYHYVYDFAWMEFSNQEILLIRKIKK